MLQLRNLVKTYKLRDKNVEALRGVDFDFPETGIVFIVGKSGSGKSTMLNVLGLLDSFDEGDLLIDGRSVRDFSQKEKDSYRALNIGFIFQEFHLIDKYNVGQNLMLPMEIQHKDVTRADVDTVLKKVDLDGYFNRKSTELSGGQKQRVAIARAIIKQPKIILADEPTGSLDSVTGKSIFKLLKGLSRERLVIIISHDTESAHKYGDLIIELKDGKIDSIVQADNRETVTITANKLDKNTQDNINSLIADGKKVIVSQPIITKTTKEKKEYIAPEGAPVAHDKIKLPFKTSARLALLSMKARWVRTIFTVFIAMFAIAFFGFSDMLSQYDSDKLLADDVHRTGLPFTSVRAYQLEDDTELFPSYRTIPMNQEVTEKLIDSTGMQLIRRHDFNLPAMQASYVNYWTERYVPDYYSSTVSGFIEVDDLSQLGLSLSAGRMPKNFDEIIITNYQFEGYKLFGIEHSNSPQQRMITPANSHLYFKENIFNINTWQDIEGKVITPPYYYNGSADGRTFKIVGMIDFDLSAFDEVASVTQTVTRATQEQRLLLRQASVAKSTYLNNWFVKSRFWDDLIRDVTPMRLRNYTLSHEDTEIEVRYNNIDNYTLDHHMFSNHAALHWAEGFTVNDLVPNQIVISHSVLESLVPSEVWRSAFVNGEYVSLEAYRELLAEYAWGKTVYVSVENVLDNLYQIGVKKYPMTVVGVYAHPSPFFIASQDFYDQQYHQYAYTHLLAINNRSDINNAIDTLNKVGLIAMNIDGNDVQIQFAIGSPNSSILNELNNYFVVLKKIFSTVALVFFGFAILLTYSFISASISSRKKDIGILRSLGASRFDVARIFIIEGVMIVIAKIVLGIVTCYAAFRLVYHYFLEQFGFLAENYQIISFGPRQMILIALLTIVAVTVSIIIPIIRIANKEPVNAIRE